MGNSVHCLFGFRAARPGRAEATEFPGPAVDDAEIDVGDAKDPVAAVGLAGERLADEDARAAPLDGAVGAHPAHRVPGVVPSLGQGFGAGPRRRGARAPRSVVGQAPHGGSCGCTTEHESAHRPDTRRVLYRRHPWAGRLVRVGNVVEKAGIARARCALDGAVPGLWQEVPLWMFDRVVCAGTRVEERGQVDLAHYRLWHRSCRMRWVRLPRRAQAGSAMTRIGERPMRDRHGAHRKRGNGSDQLDLFARAESSLPADTPESDRAGGSADAGPRARSPRSGGGR